MSEANVIYLFHGEDQVACEEALAELRQETLPREAADLAFTRLDGEDLSLASLIEHCQALPFLSPRRLVVVQGWAGQLERKGELLRGLTEYLPHLASSTVLVFRESRSLPSDHPLVALVGRVGQVREFAPPRERELPSWIARRVRGEGAEITPAACELLATVAGRDTGVLLREIEKLVTHVGPQGRIDERIVAELASEARLSNIFALVDALGQRRRARALVELRRLLQAGEHPLGILAMVTRQFRLLWQLKGLPADSQRTEEVARTLRVPRFLVERLLEQARLFRQEELRSIYQRLVEADREIKTGQRDGEVVLELLVVEVAGSRA
ncbi:MAG: DNA polymerase III subunit delta [Chloroflexia bacterium]